MVPFNGFFTMEPFQERNPQEKALDFEFGFEIQNWEKGISSSEGYPDYFRVFQHWLLVLVKGWAPTGPLKVRQIRNDFFKLTFLPKNERTNSTLLLADLFSFVFWKKVKTPKRHFEINWPLWGSSGPFPILVKGWCS